MSIGDISHLCRLHLEQKKKVVNFVESMSNIMEKENFNMFEDVSYYAVSSYYLNVLFRDMGQCCIRGIIQSNANTNR